jgi:hypothetical protein
MQSRTENARELMGSLSVQVLLSGTCSHSAAFDVIRESSINSTLMRPGESPRADEMHGPIRTLSPIVRQRIILVAGVTPAGYDFIFGGRQ